MGLVLWRGKPVSKGRRSEKLRIDTLDIQWSKIRSLGEWNIIPQGLPLQLIYKDEHLAAYTKPPGLPSHPLTTSETDSVVHRLVKEYVEAQQNQEGFLLNRLDTLTSGLILWAVNESKYQDLTPLFRRGSSLGIKKYYVALVLGHPPWESTECSVELVSRGKRQDPLEESDGSDTRTEFSVLHRLSLDGNEVSILTCSLEHGRRHQIRAHLKILGFPLAGDKVYGPGILAGAKKLDGGHGLHSWKIEIAPGQLYPKGLLLQSELPQWALMD